jgi:hypothetical protein
LYEQIDSPFSDHNGVSRLGTGTGIPHSFGQLQAGISSDQLDTSDMHAGQLIINIDCDVNIIGSGIARNAVVESEVFADLDEFSKLKLASSLAKQYIPCVDQYKIAYSHYPRAADLNEKHSRIRLSSSPQP